LSVEAESEALVGGSYHMELGALSQQLPVVVGLVVLDCCQLLLTRRRRRLLNNKSACPVLSVVESLLKYRRIFAFVAAVLFEDCTCRP